MTESPFDRTGRWLFSLPRSAMSRMHAWDRCRRSGAKLGIPEFAWRRRHTQDAWCWETAPIERIELQAQIVAKITGVPA